MESLRNRLFATAILLCTPAAFAWQGNTPEGALEELITAEKIEVMARHLPVEIEKAISKLDADQKKEVSAKLLVRSRMKAEGIIVTKSDDGITWEVKNEKGQMEATVKLKNSFVSGTDGLLSLEITEHRPSEEDKGSGGNSEPSSKHLRDPQLALVSMRLEGGEWRVIAFGPWERKTLDTEDFLRQVTPNQQEENAAAALAMLRTLTTALVTYTSTYPKVGLPDDLQQLAGFQGNAPSPEHAMLIDPGFNVSPVMRDGYEFRYTVVETGHINPATGYREGGDYQLTAKPVEFGKTGSKSFFTNNSGVIRITTENREATENDEPL